ncbi:RICIN domain-containing protein [Knoellia sp. CPCC 206453]|uniref:RICIN domain-containing protein n=1 Tax=Knoellia pratensis TaxID=3404796 RepID=UPI0036235D5C
MVLLLRTSAVALTAALAATAISAAAGPTAAAADPVFTVNVGAKGGWTTPDDTPAGMYLDKDGTFWFQQAHALYGPNDGRTWSFFSGTNIDTATKSSISTSVNPANTNDSNGDTTWRCNNSPTGLESTYAPSGSGYSQRNYCDLAGVWVDPDTGNWHGLVHNEFTPQPFSDGLHYDSIDNAVSTDQGKTWTIKEHVITSPYSTKRGDTTAFPQQTYDYGDGDPRLFVDTASGYFYVYYGSRIVDKGGSWKAFYSHVARAPISGKLAKGSWQKWYGGAWSQAGVGGRESNLVPVTTTNTTGYTPTAKEYNPANPGTTAQQVAAGTTPATSPLFVMDITWNAHLGLYIGEPQNVDQSGNAPQEFYATDNLTTQKWKLIGTTGAAYRTASWYRWFVDSVNKTSSGIVGKDFRIYCSFGCSGGTSSEYVNLSIDTTAPASPVDTTKAYRIAAGGRLLAQETATSATTSVATDNGRATWAFAANGDGSYRISNTTSGGLLGVASTSSTSRAWGTRPTVTAAPAGGPAVGQQWWVIPGASSSDGTVSGSYRIVNRYSGLVIGLSSLTARLAETTPARFWNDTSGSSVGSGRTGAEQTLSLTAVGTSGPPSLAGTRTLVSGGKALDNPDHSTTPGRQLITWTATSGANQKWQFVANADGSYTVTNVESGLCMDVDGGSLSAGARIIQWTCTGSANQKWNAQLQADGTHTVKSASSGLLVTTTSSSDGALVTQQADSGSALQRWTIS